MDRLEKAEFRNYKIALSDAIKEIRGLKNTINAYEEIQGYKEEEIRELHERIEEQRKEIDNLMVKM